MTTLGRRIVQAGALAMIALACFSEVKFSILPGGGVVWELSPDWYGALVYIVPGSAFFLAGVIAWSLRPRNRIGLLMIGVGIGLLTGDALLQDRVGQLWRPAGVVMDCVSPL